LADPAIPDGSPEAFLGISSSYLLATHLNSLSDIEFAKMCSSKAVAVSEPEAEPSELSRSFPELSVGLK
jgi:hypothetical protein